MPNIQSQEDLLGSLLWIPSAILYLPLGVLAAVVILEIMNSAQRSRQMDRSILVLLVMALVCSLMATHLAFFLSLFLNDWPNFPFRTSWPGYALSAVLFFAWLFKLRGFRSAAKLAQLPPEHRSKHRSSGMRTFDGLYQTCLVASVILIAVCLRYQASFTGSATVIALDFQTKGITGRNSATVASPGKSIPAAATKSDPEATDPESTGDSPLESGMAAADPPAAMPEPEKPATPAVGPPPAVTGGSAPPPVDPDSYYAMKVQPILEEKCYDCHGADKDKGDLRVHTPNAIRTGGKEGEVLVAGAPNDSSLYYRTILDPDDDDIMPSKGDLLTEDEKAVLKKWVEDGADLGDGLALDDMSTIATEAAMAGGESFQVNTELTIPHPAVLESLAKADVEVTPVSSDGLFLEVNYSRADKPAGALNLKELYPIAQNVVSLDLSKTRITDADVEPVREFRNLVRLKLDRTNTGNEALSHLSDLTKLEYISLFGTRVDDSGLFSLENLKSLKELLVVNTLITPDGAKRLQKDLPDTEIMGPE